MYHRHDTDDSSMIDSSKENWKVMVKKKSLVRVGGDNMTGDMCEFDSDNRNVPVFEISTGLEDSNGAQIHAEPNIGTGVKVVLTDTSRSHARTENISKSTSDILQPLQDTSKGDTFMTTWNGISRDQTGVLGEHENGRFLFRSKMSNHIYY